MRVLRVQGWRGSGVRRGCGTLDETFEVITWQQLGLHSKPIAVLNVGGEYWKVFESLIEETIAQGFADAAIRDLFTVSRDVESLLVTLEEHATKRLAASSQRF